MLLIGRSGARHAVDYARMRRFRSVFLFTISPARPAVSLSVPDRLLPPGACCSSPPPPALSGRDCGGGISSGRFFHFHPFGLSFLVLLVYTLFSPCPSMTPISMGQPPRLYAAAAYTPCAAIPACSGCRGFIYACTPPWGLGCFWRRLLSLLLFDIAYVVFQDRWSFPKQFPEYDDYRQSTPFLLPNVRSIRQCVRTWRGTGDGSHEV